MKIFAPSNIPCRNQKILLGKRIINEKYNKLLNNTIQNTNFGLFSQDLKCKINFGKNIKNFNNISNNKNLSKVSFGAREEDNSPLYDEFMTEYRNIYGDNPVEEVINAKIDDLTPIGVGKDKIVYKFPGLENYVISEWHKRPQVDKYLSMKPNSIRFPKYNFGEYFMSNGYYGISKYVDGEVNSYTNYVELSNKFIRKTGSASSEMAQEYLLKLRLIKDFPQEAFDDLALKINYLKLHEQFFDFMNPNNMFVDVKLKRFNIIDLPEDNSPDVSIYKNKKRNMGLFELLSLLIDLKFQCYFLDQLNENEKNEVKSISRDIIKKSISAIKKVGMSLDDICFLNTLQLLESVHVQPIGLTERYKECKDLYKDILP